MILFSRIKRLLKKSPSYVFRRLFSELQHDLDRFSQPRYGRKFTDKKLLNCLGDLDIESCWSRLERQENPFYFPANPLDHSFELGEGLNRVLKKADQAMEHKIDLMGSGLISLGETINWLQDYKSGDVWPTGYFRGIDYINPGRSSDVKTVWELSRMQWLIPCGQAYVLTGDEKYARATKEVLESWIASNPYAMTVNWAVTMEPAMRIFVFIWLFHALSKSEAWSDEHFRATFLRSLYSHAVFTERFIERSDVNGNHFTADAAALVVAGSFFGAGVDSERWIKSGIFDLETEIIRQVGSDGGNFEGSVAYHRLVAELLLIAAMFANSSGYKMTSEYLERLRLMGYFSAAYSRPDGTSPLLGDADDARTLPFGFETVIDHRYLPGLIGLFLKDTELTEAVSAPRAEAWWWFGPEGASKIPYEKGNYEITPSSAAFPESGYYVLRDKRVHSFIDCAAVGLAGRGGHGHNDILSFELALDGVWLISDAGSYVYTGDFEARNMFRSGRVHNTPMVSDQEQNRFHGPNSLWTLEYDATPSVRSVELQSDKEVIEASHAGYSRLDPPIFPVRKFVMIRDEGKFTVEDSFECRSSSYDVNIPLQLAPGISLGKVVGQRIELIGQNRKFYIEWSSAGFWEMEVSTGWVSMSYANRVEAPRLHWISPQSKEALVIEIGICDEG
jgi:hypothetical protein